MLSDLIVLGLPYSATEDEMRAYFEKFGTLAHCEIKFEGLTKKSRGFGFVRYTTVEEVETVIKMTHNLGGRKLEVRFPNKPGQDSDPTKLFIGRLPQGTTEDDLRECFSEYAPLQDVYVPKNFRGFGFVTFGSQSEAQEVLNSTHIIKGNVLNISQPAPKQGQMYPQGMQMQNYSYGNMQGNIQGGMQGNMQMPPQQGNGYGYGGGQGNQMNNGYYTSAYYQRGGTMQGGKVM